MRLQLFALLIITLLTASCASYNNSSKQCPAYGEASWENPANEDNYLS